jgi:hypothetical protein
LKRTWEDNIEIDLKNEMNGNSSVTIMFTGIQFLAGAEIFPVKTGKWVYREVDHPPPYIIEFKY